MPLPSTASCLLGSWQVLRVPAFSAMRGVSINLYYLKPCRYFRSIGFFLLPASCFLLLASCFLLLASCSCRVSAMPRLSRAGFFSGARQRQGTHAESVSHQLALVNQLIGRFRGELPLRSPLPCGPSFDASVGRLFCQSVSGGMVRGATMSSCRVLPECRPSGQFFRMLCS